MDTIGVDAYYFNLSSAPDLAKTVLNITQTILADGVIVNFSFDILVLPSELDGRSGDVMWFTTEAS